MTTRVVLPAADADLGSILDYLETEAGPRVALKYTRLFEQALDRIEQHPGIGAPRPALGALARIVVVSPYVMIYDHDRDVDSVTVVRVLHGRRDITKRLLSR
jgi:toxin ParE1/3/4